MPPINQNKSALAGLENQINSEMAAANSTPVSVGIRNVPAGIKAGIAQLESIKFGIYKDGASKGKTFCRLVGICKFPHTIDSDQGEVPVYGAQTSVMVALCETKTKQMPPKVTTFRENLAICMHHMKLLANNFAEDETALFPEGSTAADLERVANELCEQKPYFRFETRVRPAQVDPVTKKKRGDDGVWETWLGSAGLEDWSESVPESHQLSEDKVNGTPLDEHEVPTPPVEPKTNFRKGSPPQAAPTPRKTITPPQARTQAAPKPQPPKKAPPQPIATASGGEPDDLEALLVNTRHSDEAIHLPAQQSLITMAVEAGYTQEDAEAADSYEDVVEMIRNPVNGDDNQNAEGGEEPAQDEGPEPPAVGNFYSFAPADPNNKRKRLAPVKVKVVSVNEDNQTATVRDMGAKKNYEHVGWGRLT